MAWYDWGDRKVFDHFMKDHPQYRGQIYELQSYFDKEMNRLFDLYARLYHIWDLDTDLPKWDSSLDEHWDVFVSEHEDAECLMLLRRKKDIFMLVLNSYESEV